MNFLHEAQPAPPPILFRPDALLELSGDRDALLAARRAFVEMKQCFMRAVADVPGAIGDSLRHKVRHSGEPIDLWRLRRAVLATLPPTDPRCVGHRAVLQRHLDALFPDSDDTTSFVAL
jgi:hypothetical protein